MMAFAATCAFMWRHIHRPLLCILITGICAFFLNFTFNFTLIGWDATSNALLIIEAICLLLYLERPNNRNLIIFAIVCAVATCSRIPNIILVPVAGIILLMFHWHRKSPKQTLISASIFGITFVATTLLLIIIFFGSIGSYQYAIEQNTISQHSLLDILKPWNTYINTTIPSACYIIILYFAFNWAFNKPKHPALQSFVALVICIIFVRFFLIIQSITESAFPQWLSYGYLLILLAYIPNKISFFVPAEFSSNSKTKCLNLEWLILITILSYSLLAGFGSNMAVHKMLIIILAPLAFAYILNRHHKILLAFSTFLIIVFSPVLILKKRSKAFFDTGFKESTEQPAIPLLHGIKTNTPRATYLNNLYSSIEANKDLEKVFVADNANRFMGYYLDETKPKHDFHNWDSKLLNDTTFINNTVSIIKKSSSPIGVWVLKFSSQDEYSEMERTLDSLNPSEIEELDNIRIYKYCPQL